jgi:DNA invertase Pin-like site-specific DNA recombinase
MCSYVAYYRVSTEKQGKSGLGLEAQMASTGAFVASHGANAKLLAAYTEVESGKRSGRPELARALEHARLTGATLLIAKLDRLSRDAHFLLGLQKANVKFTAVDMPQADNFTVGIMALVAQKEREAISERTKAALAAAKARGTKLGSPKGAVHLAGRFQPVAIEAVRRNATERARRLKTTIAVLKAEGVSSANSIATALNQREIATPRGGKWTARSVINIMARLSGV